MQHSDRAHAKLSPSSSQQWINCPGSIQAQEGLPDTDNEYAIQGTTAHQLAEICMTKDAKPEDFMGKIIKVKLINKTFADIEVDAAMVKGAKMYVTWFKDEIADAEIWQFPKSLYMVETKVKITAIQDTGTADAIIYKEATKTLVIGDLKYGFNLVDPEENTQALLYAMGAAALFPQGAIEHVEITIIQPRGMHPDGPIRTWKMSYDEMLDWELFLYRAVEKTEEPNALRKAGKWCKYCKAAFTCETLRNSNLDVAMAQFDTQGNIILPEPQRLTPAQLGRILESVEALEGWMKSIKTYAEAEAQAGRIPPNFKLVAKRATRSWVNEEAAKGWLKQTFADAELFTEPKLKSPNQIEEEVGKAKATKEGLAKFTQSISSGSKLVMDCDPRQLSRPTAESDFGRV